MFARISSSFSSFVAMILIGILSIAGSSARASVTQQLVSYNSDHMSFTVGAGSYFSPVTGAPIGTTVFENLNQDFGTVTYMNAGYTSTGPTTGIVTLNIVGNYIHPTEKQPFSGIHLSANNGPLMMDVWTNTSVDDNYGKGLASPADQMAPTTDLWSYSNVSVGAANMVLENGGTAGMYTSPDGSGFDYWANFQVGFVNSDPNQAVEAAQMFSQAIGGSNTPEPASIALLGLGSCGLLLRRRRAMK